MGTTFVKPGRVIGLTATAAWSSDDVVVIGGYVGVVQVNAVINTVAQVSVTGIHTLAALTGTAFTEGQPLFWDAGNSRLTNAVTAVYAGLCADEGGKASAAATTQVDLGRVPGGALASAMTGGDRLSVAVAPNATVVELSVAPYDLTITGMKVLIDVAAVTAGAYTLAVSGAGNNLLGAANYDLTAAVADTVTAIGLTATAADLNLDQDDILRFTLTSNNADLTGDGLVILPQWRAR